MPISILDKFKSTSVELNTSEQSTKECPLPVPHNGGSVKDSINTGFSTENSLDLTPCADRTLSQPLYKENYLSEFTTEDEQRQARHNLGLYDDKDVVAMNLLTTGDKESDKSILDDFQIKVMQQGGKSFATQTVAKAVMVKKNGAYTDLQSVLSDYDTSVSRANTRIDALLAKSTTGASIRTVGDVNAFLTGYQTSQTLSGILGDYLQFESKGEITQEKWQI